MIAPPTRPLLVLRPEPGNSATCRAARDLALHSHAVPLFKYVAKPWYLDDTRWDGLLFGSAAAVTHSGPQLAALRNIPVHAVGQATARMAQEAGFTIAGIGTGGLQPVVSALPPGRYLRPSGEARVPLDLPPGVSVTDAVTYAAQPVPLAQSAIDLIRREPVVALLHSAEAARHFAAQCTIHDLARSTVTIVCLGPRIASAAGDGWAAVGIAQNPTDEALLSLARQMCQTV